MTTETVLQTIKKVCEGKCSYEIHLSETTNSVYCTLRWGNCATRFRVSDHMQRIHKMRSFTYFKKTKVACLERFIANAISDLKQKNLYFTLESMAAAV